MKICININIFDYDINSSTVVYGVKSLGFHSFEALNDNLEGLFFHRLIFTSHHARILIACTDMQLRFLKLNTLTNAFLKC